VSTGKGRAPVRTVGLLKQEVGVFNLKQEVVCVNRKGQSCCKNCGLAKTGSGRIQSKTGSRVCQQERVELL